MLERSLNVIACTVLTKPHHPAISDLILEKNDPNCTSNNIELTPSQCMATLLAILFLILKLLKSPVSITFVNTVATKIGRKRLSNLASGTTIYY